MMDPSLSNCENIDDESIRDNEDYEMDFLSSVAALLDCEDFRDEDAPKELGMNTPPPPPPLGDAEEELSTNVFRAAMNGKVRIFNKPSLSNGDFFKKTREQDNILHIAVRYEQKEFVRAFLKRYFIFNKKLISERNSQGNTPLHVAAEVGDEGIVMLLFNYMKKSVEGGHDDDEEEKPWRAQNSQGNTTLHVALLSGNFEVAKVLVERDGCLARMVNNSLEAPLHLAITHLDDEDDCKLMTRVLLEKARCVATWRDAKGLTPLLRTASLLYTSVILEATKKIIDVCPESTLVCDPFGKSFLHLLIHNKILEVHKKNLDKGFKFNYKEDIENLISLKEITILKDHQDQDGNTPLHIAVKCENITMVRSLLSDKCLADYNITNNDGISARFRIEQQNLWNQLREPRAMTREESSSANKGDINFLRQMQRTIGVEFYGSQDSKGSNFLHLLMSKKTEHHNLYSSYDYRKFFAFIQLALTSFPELLCQTDQKGNTPLHNLAQNKDVCKTLAAPTLEHPSPLSKLLSVYAEAINRIKSRRTTTNESDNHNQIPWVMQNADGNTPLHEALIANNKVFVLQLLRYSKESATIVNNNKETPLHLLAATDNGMEPMEKFTAEEIMEMVKANTKAGGLQDKDGCIPMSRAIEVKNLNVVVTLLCNFQYFRNTNDKTLWQIFCIMEDQSINFLKALFQYEAFRRMMLGQKNENGNTLLHIAIRENCFGFVRELLETRGSERWLTDLLRIPNNIGVTSEDLLADLPTLPLKLEEKLLTDRRMMGIRSSWRIPRTQLENYMMSINVIAALQTTITFTAAFTVPGGLIQDKGFPILIQSIAFQVFMISDVMAMCLSMMVLIWPFWLVSGTRRKSVEILDFTLSLLQASFVATLLAFMSGVCATIYPVKPWIAITTVVLCSLLTLLLHKFIVTELLLPSKRATANFVQLLWGPAAAFCSKTIKKLRSDEFEHTHMDNSDTSPNQRNIV